MSDDDRTVSLGDWDPRRRDRDALAATLPSPGDAVDHYVVLELVGTGGMGAVLAAWDGRLERRVALKLLLPERGTTDAVARLHREAQAMARLNHPNVAVVHDVGEVGGWPYVAMEFVDGVDLARWLDGGGRTWREVLDTFLAAGEGLAAAHRAGIVHRDFKPSNVMVGADGRIRVTDFGLARALSADPGDAGDAAAHRPSLAERDRSSPLETDLTLEGAVLGTPAYMAPEQVLEGRADARTDQFAFCVALHEALYGVHPFSEARSPAELASRAIGGPAQPPSGSPAVPSWLFGVLARGLEADPTRRHDGMPALLAALRDEPGLRRRRRRLAAAAATLVLAAAGAVGLRHLAVVRACERGAEIAAAVLPSGRRAAIADRFAAVAGAAGRQAAQTTLAQVDAHLARWADVRRSCCRATRVDGERSAALLDHEVACLDRGLATADALLTMLGTADRELVAAVDDAVSGLPPPEACWEASGLAGRPPLPSDPAARASVDAAQEMLATADALYLGGRFERRLETAVEAVAAAESAGYRPVTAEALIERGVAEADLGRNDRARESLTAGLEAAERGRDDHQAASATIHLAWVAGVLDVRFGEAERWRRIAAAKIERLGGDPRLEAELADTAAGAFRQQGDYRSARAEQQRNLELVTALEGADSLPAARAHHALGLVLAEQGELEDALTELNRALQLKRLHLGSEHPGLAATLVSRADVLAGLDRGGEAVTDAERGLEILESVLGAGHRELATALNNLAVAYEVAGRLDDAETTHLRGLELVRKTLGPDHPQLGYTALNLAILRHRRGDPAAAVVPALEAAAVLANALGGEHPHVAFAENNLGMFLLYAGRPADAVAHLETALRIRAAAGVDPVLLEQTRFNLARAAWSAGQRSRATGLAGSARAALAALGEHGAETLGRVDAWLRSPA